MSLDVEAVYAPSRFDALDAAGLFAEEAGRLMGQAALVIAGLEANMQSDSRAISDLVLPKGREDNPVHTGWPLRHANLGSTVVSGFLAQTSIGQSLTHSPEGTPLNRLMPLVATEFAADDIKNLYTTPTIETANAQLIVDLVTWAELMEERGWPLLFEACFYRFNGVRYPSISNIGIKANEAGVEVSIYHESPELIDCIDGRGWKDSVPKSHRTPVKSRHDYPELRVPRGLVTNALRRTTILAKDRLAGLRLSS